MMKKSETLLLIAILAVALNGVVCTALSLFLIGAGHGWASAAVVSWLALPACPAMLAIANLRGRPARIGASIAIVVAIVADLVIWQGPYADASDFEHVWDVGAPFLIGWMVSWFSWQLAAVLTLVRPARLIVVMFFIASVIIDLYAVYVATLIPHA